MSKYLDRISASKDEKAKAGAVTAEKHAKLDIEAFIGAKKKTLATVEEAKDAALGAVPFNIQNVVRLAQEEAALTADVKTAEAILASEFGSN